MHFLNFFRYSFCICDNRPSFRRSNEPRAYDKIQMYKCTRISGGFWSPLEQSAAQRRFSSNDRCFPETSQNLPFSRSFFLNWFQFPQFRTQCIVVWQFWTLCHFKITLWHRHIQDFNFAAGMHSRHGVILRFNILKGVESRGVKPFPRKFCRVLAENVMF